MNEWFKNREKIELIEEAVRIMLQEHGADTELIIVMHPEKEPKDVVEVLGVKVWRDRLHPVDTVTCMTRRDFDFSRREELINKIGADIH